MSEINYTRLTGAELTAVLGDDASKWATALTQYMRNPQPRFDLSYDSLRAWFANAIVTSQDLVRQRMPMTPAEALYGIMAWLTTRDQPVTLSRVHESGVAVELIQRFAAVNDIELNVRHGRWPNNLKMPQD